MSEYFDREDRWRTSGSFSPSILKEDVPVQAKEASTWTIETNPNRLKKQFEFETPQGLRNFLADLLDHEEDSGHNAKIIIMGNSVLIEVYTHYIEDITEIDQEYADVCDEIYKDSNDVVDE